MKGCLMSEDKLSDVHSRCPYATGTHKTPCIWCKMFDLFDRQNEILEVLECLDLTDGFDIADHVRLWMDDNFSVCEF